MQSAARTRFAWPDSWEEMLIMKGIRWGWVIAGGTGLLIPLCQTIDSCHCGTDPRIHNPASIVCAAEAIRMETAISRPSSAM